MKISKKYTTEPLRHKGHRVNLFIIFALCLCASVVFLNPLFARTGDNAWHPKRDMDFKWYAKNQWKLPITNYGTFGYGINRPGGEWPRGSGNMYIYGAGIWVGALPTRRETLVTCGYDPSSGSSEFTPGCWENATTPGNYARSFERVYVYPEDWPPIPTDFPESMRDSVATFLRIPLATGDTIRGRFYPIPRKTISTGDAWAVLNDRDITRHVRSDPAIGIEIYQTTYSWSLPWNRDIVFFSLTIKNISGHELKDVYLGMACDADIGDAADDMCGLILRKFVRSRAGTDSVYADNVGYVFDSNFDEGWDVPPGYVGFDFLQSPYAYNDSIDNNHNGIIDEGPDGLDNNDNGLIDEPAELEQLGMTSYKIFTLAAGDPRDNFAQYLAMTGRAWRPPYELIPYDSTDAAPADKRFLQATGPFNLDTNALATVTIAVIAAPSNPVAGIGDLYQLALASSAAQAAYDNNWIMPTPPPSPNVTLIPGEGRITLIWDNSPENAPDVFYPYAAALRNPFYREVDFQGYKVYKSLTGQVGEWQLLDKFDKIDEIKYVDPTTNETLATDKGLSYAYIDSVNIRLGFPYYYAVTAFDVNTMGYVSATTDTSWLSLESGLDPKATIARTVPINYLAPQYKVSQKRGRSWDTLKLKLNPTTLTNYAVQADTYNLKFLAPLPAGEPSARIPQYRFLVQKQNGDTAVRIQSFTLNIRQAADSVSFHPTIFDSVITNLKQNRDSAHKTDTTKAYMPIIDLGFTLRMDSVPWQFFDRVEVKSGTYPRDSIQLPTTLTANFALWAYRGSDFKVAFKEKYPGGPITADVFDITLNQPVPYRRMTRSVQTMPISDRDSADGWCFTGAVTGADTLVPNTTRFLLLCGGQINLNKSNVITNALMPAPGDTWIIYSTLFSASPAYSEFQIVSFPMLVADTSISKLKVKVVPNPYLVRNEWERHPDFRKIKFINLPTECTIRIYNFAGDLIKTLRHAATKTEDPGNVPFEAGGDENWDLLSESGQKPAPGIYLFHVESKTGNQIGKFVIIY